MVSEDSFFKYIWVLPSVFISRDSDSFQKPRPPLYKMVIPISIIFFPVFDLDRPLYTGILCSGELYGADIQWSVQY